METFLHRMITFHNLVHLGFQHIFKEKISTEDLNPLLLICQFVCHSTDHNLFNLSFPYLFVSLIHLLFVYHFMQGVDFRGSL